MKVGRYLLLILIGGVIGGFIECQWVINTNNLLRITHFSNVKTVLIIVGLATIINIILTLYLYILFRTMHSNIKRKLLKILKMI